MKYYRQIDGLRFIAILLVLVSHLANFIGKHISAGYYGVDLFFVISGFLITGILFKTPDQPLFINFKNFIGRRILRIFPIYYLTILLICLFDFDFVKDKVFWAITYTYNYAWVYLKYPDSPFTHFWSLGVEEQFYLFWPILILTLKKKPKVLLSAIAFTILLGYTQFYANIFPSISKYNSVSIITRMSSLGIGAFGAIYSTLYRLPDKIFTNRHVEMIVLILLATTLLLSPTVKNISLPLFSLYLVLKAAHYGFSISWIDTFLKNRTVVYIGTISYGIYVFHVPIWQYLNPYFEMAWTSIDFSALGIFEKIRYHRWLGQFPIYSGLSIAVASFSYRFIESPILKLKDRYFKI